MNAFEHRLNPESLTPYRSLGGLTVSNFPPLTGWTKNVLLPSYHRVDQECLTSFLSQGGPRLSYFLSVAGWNQFCYKCIVVMMF